MSELILNAPTRTCCGNRPSECKCKRAQLPNPKGTTVNRKPTPLYPSLYLNFATGERWSPEQDEAETETDQLRRDLSSLGASYDADGHLIKYDDQGRRIDGGTLHDFPATPPHPYHNPANNPAKGRNAKGQKDGYEGEYDDDSDEQENEQAGRDRSTPTSNSRPEGLPLFIDGVFPWMG